MKWYYADAGRQVGPVDEAALDELVRAGTVRDDTLVWREGMAGWQPHGSVRGVKPPPPAPMPVQAGAATTSYCSECGRPFPSQQLVAVGNASVCPSCKAAYLQRLGGGAQTVGARHYAGFWIRFVARLIDGVILGVVGFVIRLPMAGLIGVSAIDSTSAVGLLPMIMGMVGISIILQIVISIAYEAYFVSAKGGTLGKLALGLRIIRADGSGVPMGLAIGRFFAQIISAIILWIGYIMAGFDPEKRSLHDRICDTRVIYSK